MFKGQMTYHRTYKLWNFTENKNLTSILCNSIFKIQSRNSYYRATAGNLTNSGPDLETLIKWVENHAHN